MGYSLKLLLQFLIICCSYHGYLTTGAYSNDTALYEVNQDVTKLTATFEQNKIYVTWEGSNHAFISEYDRKKGHVIGAITFGTSPKIFLNCTRGKNYTFTAIQSNVETLVDITIPYEIRPAKLNNNNSFTLEWLSPTIGNVTGYTVYTKAHRQTAWTSHNVSKNCGKDYFNPCFYTNNKAIPTTVYDFRIETHFVNGMDVTEGVINSGPLPGENDIPMVKVEGRVATVTWKPIINFGNEVKEYRLFRKAQWFENGENSWISTRKNVTTFSDNFNFKKGKNYTYYWIVIFQNGQRFDGKDSNSFTLQ